MTVKFYRPEDVTITIGGVTVRGDSLIYAEPIIREADRDTQPDLIQCKRCTFTLLAPGKVCSWCDWRRPE